MVEKGKEIAEVLDAVVEPEPVSPLDDDQLLQVAREAEARVEAVNTIKRLVLKVTNSNDWTDQGGTPYLWGSGAEKVALVFGISYKLNEHPTKHNEEGGHYRWEWTGTFTLRGTSILAIGSRSSKSKFFSVSHGRDIPPSEIDEGNVKKAAYTNCVNNGIKRLLGIRNLTWEELKVAGITPENVGTKVTYGSNKEAPTKLQLNKIQALKKHGIKTGAFGEAEYYQALDKVKAKHSTDLSKHLASKFIEWENEQIAQNQPPVKPKQETPPA